MKATVGLYTDHGPRGFRTTSTAMIRVSPLTPENHRFLEAAALRASSAASLRPPVVMAAQDIEGYATLTLIDLGGGAAMDGHEERLGRAVDAAAEAFEELGIPVVRLTDA